MKHIFLDIKSEINSVEEEYRMLCGFRAEFEKSAPSMSKFAEWAGVNAMASGIEKIYTGIEKVLRDLIGGLDGDLPVGDSWHAKLLTRAASATDDRPAIISPEVFEILNVLRGFRHRERNIYGTKLELPKVLENEKNVERVLPMLQRDIEALRLVMTSPLGPDQTKPRP